MSQLYFAQEFIFCEVLSPSDAHQDLGPFHVPSVARSSLGCVIQFFFNVQPSSHLTKTLITLSQALWALPIQLNFSCRMPYAIFHRSSTSKPLSNTTRPRWVTPWSHQVTNHNSTLLSYKLHELLCILPSACKTSCVYQ